MSAHSPWMQFVIRLSDSLKTEAKCVVLVRGLWYETLGSPRLPFNLNQSHSFLYLFQLGGACTLRGSLCFDIPLFYGIFLGRHRRGMLVSCMEKASLDHIKRLLEIIEGERNHKLLLFVKNL